MAIKDVPNEKEFITVAQAAAYINVSAQTLRRWDAEGKLKSIRHPASGYRFYKRSDLEPFRLEYRRAETSTPDVTAFFQTTVANIEANEHLREPQRKAHEKIRLHFAASGTHAILQIPVGCGKTGIMATLPFGIAQGRTLVITPNLTIRKGVSEALDIASQKCFWSKARVIDSFVNGPFTAVLDGPNANLHDCAESHFVVTNIQQLASAADRWLPQFPPGFFDMILVDEGHHNVADSWLKVFDKFPEAKVVSLTATPFRADGQPLQGTIVYRYSYAKAMINGYIKQIHSVNVAPSEIYFTYKDDKRRHTLDQVMELREEAWFRKGVALSPECNKHIAEASILRCLSLRRKTGLKHQIIAAACSIDHARQVRAIYEQLGGMETREIYSEMEPDKQEQIIAELKDGRVDCIVQVQMLGEGFDHPPLSVAAIFRPFRSLSPYVQFAGRIMRVIHPDDPDHPDHHGYVVSHVGLNNDANWRDFREVDFDDQAIFRKWLASEGEQIDEGAGAGTPRRFDQGMLVNNEIVSHFIGQSYLNPEDDRVLDEILSQRIPGTPLKVGDLKTREELREMLKAKQSEMTAGSPQAMTITPQRRRRAAKDRLYQRTNSVAARIMKDLSLSPAGREVGKVYRRPMLSNRAALTQILNGEINKVLGIKSGQRNTLKADELEAAFSRLDEIGDMVRDKVRKEKGK
jgi:excisionase family DNA binding protein